MIRFLIILFICLYLLRGLLRATFVFRRAVPRPPQSGSPFQRPADVDNTKAIQVLSSCENCGTYFAPHQAVQKNGKVYCSPSCVAHSTAK